MLGVQSLASAVTQLSLNPVPALSCVHVMFCTLRAFAFGAPFSSRELVVRRGSQEGQRPHITMHVSPLQTCRPLDGGIPLWVHSSETGLRS